MNPYDLAHSLADAMKQSEEFTEYRRLKAIAYSDETNKALLNEYKRLSMRIQVAATVGEKPSEDEMQRFSQIGALLQFNPEVGQYMLAELRMQRMLSDIFKILADAAEIDLDAFTQG